MKCNYVITDFTICHTVKWTFSQKAVTQPITCPLPAPCAALSGSGKGAQILKTGDAAGWAPDRSSDSSFIFVHCEGLQTSCQISCIERWGRKEWQNLPVSEERDSSCRRLWLVAFLLQTLRQTKPNGELFNRIYQFTLPHSLQCLPLALQESRNGRKTSPPLCHKSYSFTFLGEFNSMEICCCQKDRTPGSRMERFGQRH